jgi:hypothetical protein
MLTTVFLTKLFLTVAPAGFKVSPSWIVGLLLVISEYLGSNPKIKENSVYQLAVSFLKAVGGMFNK